MLTAPEEYSSAISFRHVVQAGPPPRGPNDLPPFLPEETPGRDLPPAFPEELPGNDLPPMREIDLPDPVEDPQLDDGLPARDEGGSGVESLASHA